MQGKGKIKGFNSANYLFRQSALGQAFAAMGITNVPQVREPLIEGFLRDKHDNHNIRPSRPVVLNVHKTHEGAFGHDEDEKKRVERVQKRRSKITAEKLTGKALANA